MRRPLRVLVVLAALVAVLVPTAARAGGGDLPPTPTTGHPWFGPALDIKVDTPDAYVERLGAAPSLYTFPVDYPLTTAGTTQLRSFAAEAATHGAVLVLQVEPTVPLADLEQSDADDLAALLVDLHRTFDTFTLVRFAPEMNGSWRTWGQQPHAYVAAFRTVAATVHAATDAAGLVWSPVYGSGYPFGRDQGTDSEIDLSRSRETANLDTNGNGEVDPRDDPYGPYYPGDDAVDWVGLFIYRFGQSQGVEKNAAPPAQELRERLAETWGYGGTGARESFYDRFATGHGKRLLLETAALYNPTVGGTDELTLKQTWWRQVFAETRTHPLIGAISWLELDRVEPEVANQPVDWRATRTPLLAHALLTDLRASGLDLSPVTRIVDQTTANQATSQARLPARSDLPDSMGWVLIDVLVLLLVFLASGLVGRFAPRWRYTGPPDSSRDLRLDLFRGFLICTVVVTHTELAGPISCADLNIVLAVTGAEGFVLLSGVVVGMVHRPEASRLGEWAAAARRFRRARTLYLATLVTILLVYVLGRIPGVDASVVTTFTDRGTGSAGPGAAGQVYDLYLNAQHLLDYPPPWFAVRELLTLHIGPWPLNVLGLFVVLIAVTPAIMWLLLRRLWYVVLLLSWGAYAYGAHTHARLLPSQFEDVFPLLIWQVAFVTGLVIGFHREAVVRALTTRLGKVTCSVMMLVYAAALTTVYLAHRGVLPDGPLPADAWERLYDHLYVRVDLQAGRLVDMALVSVVSFAFLTAWWRPVNALVGRFLIPLGQASLYVFIVHVFLVVAVANIPGLDRSSVWQGTVIHVTELAVLWVLVTRRVLFSVVPR